MDALAGENAAKRWAAHLCRFWMDADPDAAGTLYVDGHVSVYHGRRPTCHAAMYPGSGCV
jgi:prepilin-type processing-associated H-X9-DG protein